MQIAGLALPSTPSIRQAFSRMLAGLVIHDRFTSNSLDDS
jgi:hypothetical protein